MLSSTPPNTLEHLHITRTGDGQRRFIGIHGWGSEGASSFRDLLPHLPPDATLIAPDLPGCGRSATPAAWTLEAVNDALLPLLDALPPGEQVTLIGSCSGTFHALPLAIARPERVEQLVLLEPFAAMPWFFSIFLTPITGKLLYKAVFDNPIGKAATRASLKRQQGQESYDMVGTFASSTGLEAAYNYLKMYGAIPDHTVFAAASAPVRTVCGERSWRAIHDSVPLWRQNWPDLDAHTLPNTGHMFTHEVPALAASIIFA